MNRISPFFDFPIVNLTSLNNILRDFSFIFVNLDFKVHPCRGINVIISNIRIQHKFR